MSACTTYCPAQDRNVPVLQRQGAWDVEVGHLHATGAFLCLDYGVRCTGAMCPLMAVPVTAEERAAHREGLAHLRRERAVRRERRRRAGGGPMTPLSRHGPDDRPS